ncbi:uncharacterized protein LOC131354507 [Hemibagrus wyckioides]|uniref:uncharacterized protein LOC131354507 n=1 Tax=Hemibagrus wyckioides TaxID=337641 RepID=UPI00266BE654|nr:uncharacterized protein LOC131354507 [Hemibagrus wyckioides]
MSSTQELAQSTILCKHTHTHTHTTTGDRYTHTFIMLTKTCITCLSGMFVRSLLGVCVCVALCVSQNADSEQHTPEQQDPIARKQPYVHVNNRLGVFIAAAVGTMTLMGVIYCIYNQFYTKHPYTHTELQETDSSVDISELSPPVFHSCGQLEGWMVRGMGKGGGASYGSLSDTPSIITLPPALSPPPLASPFPPPRPARPAPLRTISAQELQKNFL